MKKIIALLLSLCFTLSLVVGLTACKSDKNKEIQLILRVPPIAMKNIVREDVNSASDMLEKAAEEFSRTYKDAKVTCKVELFEYTNETEAIVNNFDTALATDILYEGYFNMQTYIHTGKVVPLDDIITDEIRKDIDDSIWEMSKIGGKTYMMPFQDSQNILIYNKELFKNCGLEKYISEENKITNWKKEEWEEILDTLAAKLPPATYPMMMYAKNDQGDTHIMTYLRSHGCKFFDDEGNFNVNCEEGKAALRWIENGMKRGWFPPNCERMEIMDCTNLFAHNQLAIHMSNNASFDYYENIDFGCVNFPCWTSENGIATSFVTGFEVFDNGDPDKLAAAKAFVKFIMTTDSFVECSTAAIPVRNSVSEKYKEDLFMLEAFAENTKNVFDFTANNPNWRGVREVFYKDFNTFIMGQMTVDEVAESIDQKCNAAISSGRKNSVLHK